MDVIDLLVVVGERKDEFVPEKSGEEMLLMQFGETGLCRSWDEGDGCERKRPGHVFANVDRAQLTSPVIDVLKQNPVDA